MSEAIFHAVEVATRAHRGQCRKGSQTPYIVHPLAVAEILTRAGCEEEVVIAGILHDTLEDTSLELEDLVSLFGSGVADLVRGATEPDRGARWEVRKRHTIEYLQAAPLPVVLVSCADKLHNLLSMVEDLRAVGEEVWTRFSRPRDRQCWYHTELARVFSNRLGDHSMSLLATRFEEVVHAVFG